MSPVQFFKEISINKAIVLKVLFVDKITLSSLCYIMRFRRLLETIFYFDNVRPLFVKCIKISQKASLIQANFKKIDRNMECVRDEQGENEYYRILEDAREICRRIKKEQFASDTIIKAMASVWSTDKVVQYLGVQTFRKEVRKECLRISLVKWLATNRFKCNTSDWALLIRKTKWFYYLEGYARSKGVRLAGYGGTGFRALSRPFGGVLKISRSMLYILKKNITGLVHLPDRERGSAATVKPPEERMKPSQTVAIRYFFRKPSFDPTERSEFFWLIDSGIPFSKVMLYDYVEQGGLDAAVARKLSESGIRLVKNRGSGLRDGQFRFGIVRVFLSIAFRLTRNGLRLLAKGRCVSSYVFPKLFTLALDHAYWYDFFSRNQVRVNVASATKTSAAQALALDTLNGVSFSYQYSISNFLSPALARVVVEDVLFVFSHVFEKRWRDIDAPVKIFVKTGFIDDAAIRNIGYLERITKERRKLRTAGAEFILCFFDENSNELWDIPGSNESAAKDYEYLIKWLLRDPTLGLVLKPKKAGTLFQRMPHLSPLINQAVDTGRCLLLKSEGIIGNIYPAEAAMMSDLSIGKSFGGTAALEASLAGVRSVLLDDLVWRSHPFYEWGCGKVIFKDWETLRASVDAYRRSPEVHTELGDWSPGIEELDPFRDGQASLRMGDFIRWVYEALKVGKSKSEALRTAAESYRRRWGLDSINFLR